MIIISLLFRDFFTIRRAATAICYLEMHKFNTGKLTPIRCAYNVAKNNFYPY